MLLLQLAHILWLERQDALVSSSLYQAHLKIPVPLWVSALEGPHLSLYSFIVYLHGYAYVLHFLTYSDLL